MSYIDHISRPTATFVSHSSFFLNNSIVMQFLTYTRPRQNLIRQSIFQLQVLKDATVLPVTAHQVSFHITEIQKSLLNSSIPMQSSCMGYQNGKFVSPVLAALLWACQILAASTKLKASVPMYSCGHLVGLHLSFWGNSFMFIVNEFIYI